MSRKTAAKGEEEPTKVELVQLVNEFLLQNGLSVTAAALRKESEKMWEGDKNGNGGGTPATAVGKWLADSLQPVEKDNERGGQQQAPREPGAMAMMPSSCSPSTGAGAKDTNNNNNGGSQKSPISPPPPSSRMATATIAGKSQRSPRKAQSSRRGGTVNQQQQQCRQTQRKGALAANASAGKLHSASRARSEQRTMAGRTAGNNTTDTEESSGQEEGKGGAQRRGPGKGGGRPMRKADSVGNIVAGGNPNLGGTPPPADPARTRPIAAAAAGGKTTDEPQQQANGVGKTEETGRQGPADSEPALGWLCSHLDFPLLSQTLATKLAVNGGGREGALLLQAIRHQITKADSLAVGEANLRAFAANDLLQLRQKKQPLFSVLLSESPTLAEIKDQLARLLNAISSFRIGRTYLLAAGGQSGGRQFLYDSTLALKGKRIVGTAAEHLMATLQKLSIRGVVQKELVLNGLLDWLAQHIVQPRLGQSALEFGTALLHNLVVHPTAQSTLLRHRDTLLGTVQWLIGNTRNAQVLQYACGTLFTLLTLPRLRAVARERGELERVLTERMQRERVESQQRPMLALAQVIRGELELERCRAADDDEDSFPDYLEADIDSTDSLVPSLIELFGQNLLCQKFLQPDAVPPAGVGCRRLPVQFIIEEDQESVPGVVPVPCANRVRPPPDSKAGGRVGRANEPAGRTQPKFASPQRRTTAAAKPAAATTPKELPFPTVPKQVHFERTNSMSSHATFVVENNNRRPLLATNGFANVVASMKGAPSSGQWQKLMMVQPRKRRVAGRGETDKLESSSSETLIVEEGGGSKSTRETEREGPTRRSQSLADVVKLNQRQPTGRRTNNGMNLLAIKNNGGSSANLFSSKVRTQREEWSRKEQEEDQAIVRSATFDGNGNGLNELSTADFKPGMIEKQPIYGDYSAVFAARPKLARTPPEFVLNSVNG